MWHACICLYVGEYLSIFVFDLKRERERERERGKDNDHYVHVPIPVKKNLHLTNYVYVLGTLYIVHLGSCT